MIDFYVKKDCEKHHHCLNSGVSCNRCVHNNIEITNHYENEFIPKFRTNCIGLSCPKSNDCYNKYTSKCHRCIYNNNPIQDYYERDYNMMAF